MSGPYGSLGRSDLPEPEARPDQRKPDEDYEPQLLSREGQ
jgi:hypothetical protein